MNIRRGESVGSKTPQEKIEFVLSQLEDNGFAEEIDWDTQLSQHVTVEEAVGALVDAEVKLNDEV